MSTPASSALRNAVSVFSGAVALPPRCADFNQRFSFNVSWSGFSAPIATKPPVGTSAHVGHRERMAPFISIIRRALFISIIINAVPAMKNG